MMLAALRNVMESTYTANMKTVGDYLKTSEQHIEHFAWLPKRMSNDSCVWLRKYIEVRHYVDLWNHPPVNGNYYSVFFTPKDHVVHLLKGSPFDKDTATEFCGMPRHHLRWLQTARYEKEEQ